jgi:hypothetical protein
MSIKTRSNWRLPAAVILALSAAIKAGPATAGESLASVSHACFANDSIVMGKRLAPRPDVVQARLNSPACRSQSTPDGSSADEAAAVQRALDRIDETLTSLYRGEVVSATPASAN